AMATTSNLYLPLRQLAIDPHDHADQADILEISLADQNRLHARVGRLKPNHVAFRVIAFDRGLVLDHRDHDAPPLGVELLLDSDEITIVDAVFDHRVALDPQREHLAAGRAAQEKLVDPHRVLDVLDRH